MDKKEVKTIPQKWKESGIKRGIQALKNNADSVNSAEEKLKKYWGKQNHDITIEIIKEEVTINGDEQIIKKVKTIKNLTRQINETSKLIKQQTAKEKLEQLKELIK